MHIVTCHTYRPKFPKEIEISPEQRIVQTCETNLGPKVTVLKQELPPIDINAMIVEFPLEHKIEYNF